MDPDADRGVALAGDPPSGAERVDPGGGRGQHSTAAGPAEQAGPPDLKKQNQELDWNKGDCTRSSGILESDRLWN